VPELRGVMTALGLPSTDAELHAAIARCDVEGRGFMDERELGVLLASELGDEPRTAELAAVFALQDPDGDGFLDAWNVAGVMTTLHPGTAAAAEVPLTPADLDAVLEEAGGGDARGMTMEAYMRLMGEAS